MAEESDLPRYKYNRTPSDRYIRLLSLTPNFSGFQSELLLRPLDSVPSFEAISYTWGDPAKTHSLMIENCSLPITKNAYEVLNNLASTGQRRLLWIDAICINQDDNEDKSQQVCLMRVIYRTASRVIIWLGNPPETCLAHAFFTRLDIQNSRNTSNEVLLLPELTNDDDATWLAFQKLLNHPYWTRVWVVQEIVVAQAADVYYGNEFWAWDLFARTVCALLSEEKRTLLRKLNRLEGLTVPHFAGVERVSMIDTIRRQYIEQSSEQCHDKLTSLPKILMQFSDSHATVKKDRIFAFLGISSASTDDALKPDYSRSDREIFEAVARHSLRNKLPFLYFSIAGLANSIESDNWPSWVPDLSKTPGMRLPSPLWDFGKYKASAETKPNVDILKLDHGISVEGVFVDTIDRVAPMRSTIKPNEAAQLRQHGRFTTKHAMLEFYKRELRRYEEAWEIAKQGTEIYAPTGQSRKEAFWWTWLCDMPSNPLQSETYSGEDHDEWMELVGAQIGNGKSIHDIDWLQKARDHSQANLVEDGSDLGSQDLPDLTSFPLRLNLSSFRRQFAVTKKGYMALVVPGIQAGDVVCVFSGSETPHALRNYDRGISCLEYRLIGDAYVHGWMDGSMFMDTENQKERFVIR